MSACEAVRLREVSTDHPALDSLAKTRPVESGIYVLMPQNQEFASIVAARLHGFMNLHTTNPKSTI